MAESNKAQGQVTLPDDWNEYAEAAAHMCPICGSLSPNHIQEDGEDECREARPLSHFL